MPFQANVLTRPTRNTVQKRKGTWSDPKNMSRLTIDGWKQLEQSKNVTLQASFVKEVTHQDNPGSW